MHRLFPIGVLLTVAIAGCARDTGGYPSLAPRPVEKLGFAEPDTPPPVAATADPALDARIADWQGALDALASGFARTRADAERAAETANGRPVGSEQWLDAQAAIATLDDARAKLSALIAGMDDAAAARAATLAPAYPPLARLHDRAIAQAKDEDDTIGRLQAKIAPA